jgi:predicted RNase H-like HicB family nuclease
MATYIGIVHKDRDSDFGVSFPDFPGCITAGPTLDEAAHMATEALTGHIALMIEDGDEIPAPSDLDTVMADPDNADGVAVLVSAMIDNTRPVRVNVMLPSDLLEQIDRVTKNRSRFLAEAARKALQAA